MPRIVDHAERRAQIVEALLTVAGRDGHHEATSRAVARELGLAVGTLWHYFPNFDDVVQAAAVEVTRRTLARIDAAGSGLRGLARLDAIIAQVLPVDAVTRAEAYVVVGFWGRLASRNSADGSPSAVAWRDRFVSALDEAIADGELAAETPRERVADLLHSISYGQQVAHVLEQPSADEHLRVAAACIAPWRTDRSLSH